MHARFITLTVAFASVLLLAACGGAGAEPGAVVNSTSKNAPPNLTGTILDVDYETALVGGVSLTLLETGEQTYSDAAGVFTFQEIPEGDVTVVVDQAVVKHAPLSAAATRERLRDIDDECDRLDHQIHIRDVKQGENISLELRIQSKRVTDARIVRAEEIDPEPEYWKRELEIELWRTNANTDPDMEGELELSLDSDGCQEFEVEVEDATVNMILEAVVIDPDGNEDSLGFLWVEPDGDGEWRLDTCDGDDLPFDVDSLLLLEFHIVEVRDQLGTPLLRGRIPELPPYDHCWRVRGAARLVSLQAPVGGHVVYRVVGCTGEVLRQRFELVAHHLDRGQEIEFFLEDPDNPGTLVAIGTVLANRHGVARLTFNTAQGDDLPHNVPTMRRLIGMRIQIRDDVTGDPLLTGRVPEPLED